MGYPLSYGAKFRSYSGFAAAWRGGVEPESVERARFSLVWAFVFARFQATHRRRISTRLYRIVATEVNAIEFHLASFRD
jgi:hypothetical protein